MSGGCAGDVYPIKPHLREEYHRLCVLALFKGDMEKIKESCQVEILTNAVLPQAISISDRVWVIATQKQIDLSRVCREELTRTLGVGPSLTLTELLQGCSAFGVSILLPSGKSMKKETHS